MHTAEEGGLGEEGPAGRPPRTPGTTNLNPRTIPSPYSRERGPHQRAEGTCLWSHRAVSPRPPARSPVQRRPQCRRNLLILHRNISEDPCQKAFISAAHPSSPARGPSSSPGGLGQEGGGLGQAPGRPNRRQLENPAWLRVSFGTPHLGHKTRTSRRFSSIGTTALSAVGPGRPVQGPGQYSSRPVGHLPVAEEGKSSTLVEGQKSEDLTPAFLQAHLVGRSSKLLDLFKRP